MAWWIADTVLYLTANLFMAVGEVTMRLVALAFGFALLGGCASTHAIEPQLVSADMDFTSAETVEVSLSNFRFSPTSLEFRSGKPYILKISNDAEGGHDFTAPEFFAAARVEAEDANRIANGQLELAGGETTSIRLVPGTGEYKLVCTHFGHSTLGMVGKIIVR